MQCALLLLFYYSQSANKLICLMIKNGMHFLAMILDTLIFPLKSLLLCKKQNKYYNFIFFISLHVKLKVYIEQDDISSCLLSEAAAWSLTVWLNFHTKCKAFGLMISPHKKFHFYLTVEIGIITLLKHAG